MAAPIRNSLIGHLSRLPGASFQEHPTAAVNWRFIPLRPLRRIHFIQVTEKVNTAAAPQYTACLVIPM